MARMGAPERWEAWEERERELEDTLGALGRRGGVFWLLMTLAVLGASVLYPVPEGFRRVFEGGIVAWGMGFVALPVWRAVVGLRRLHDDHYGGAPHRLLQHQYAAALNLVAGCYCLVAIATGWGRSAAIPLLPLISLVNCFGLARRNDV